MTSELATVLPFPTFRVEDLDPRDSANQYRIYRLREGELQLLATTPTAGGIGTALVVLADEHEFDEDDAVGVLDTRCAPRGSGVWIVNPYSHGGVKHR